ncbi:MAG: hypothetical protein PARBA_03350 [Parabacteroides sp.]
MKKDLSHLSELQKSELNILKKFVDICKRNDIEYHMTGGSLIGLVRHQGFIPWDDDIDVLMTRKEYTKFLAIAEKELPINMHLSTFDTPGHIWLVPRIIDNNTQFYLNNAIKKKTTGAWMDILVFDGVPAPGFKRNIYSFFYLLSRILYQFSNFSVAVNINKKRPLLQRIIIDFAKLSHVEKILNPVKMGHLYRKVCSYYDLDKMDYGASLSGSMLMKEFIPKKWIGKGFLMPFEDIMVYGIDENDSYLTHFYGDYMIPPSVNDRNRHNVTIK